MKTEIKIAFFDTKPYDKVSFEKTLAEKYSNLDKYKFNIKYFNNKLNLDTVDLAKNSSVICCFVNDILDEKVIEKLKSYDVKFIALRCSGYNNVDLKKAFKNINIARVPAYSPHAVAEHAASLMMSLNRKIHRAYYRIRDGNFSLNGLLGFDMHGKTAGIIGTGKIGKCLIEILKGFGMKILAFDAYPDYEYAKKIGFDYVSIEELYSNAKIISLHCPLIKETKYLINNESIKKMKNGVIIINTGRGELIDTKALIEGLKNGKIAAAGLDVYEEESDYFFEDYSNKMIDDDVLARLLTFPNVLVTSHQAFFTEEALHNIAETTFENILDFFDDKYLKNEICYQCDQKSGFCLKKQEKRCF